jgi:hypothetical protein
MTWSFVFYVIMLYWNSVAAKFQLPDYSLMRLQEGPQGWVSFLSRTGNKKERRRKLGVLFTFWCWNWKERNRRVFDHSELSAGRVAKVIQEVISGFNIAWDTR